MGARLVSLALASATVLEAEALEEVVQVEEAEFAVRQLRSTVIREKEAPKRIQVQLVHYAVIVDVVRVACVFYDDRMRSIAVVVTSCCGHNHQENSEPSEGSKRHTTQGDVAQGGTLSERLSDWKYQS